MLNFLMQRRLLLGLAALLVLIAAFVASKAGTVAGFGAFVGGMIILALVRAARREVLLGQEALRGEYARLLVEHDQLRTRLALAERRLAMLAIKLDATVELDEKMG